MEKIEAIKDDVKEKLEELRKSGVSLQKEPPIELKKFTPFLNSLKTIMDGNDHELRSKIIKRLIHKVRRCCTAILKM